MNTIKQKQKNRNKVLYNSLTVENEIKINVRMRQSSDRCFSVHL